jgi:hypothetical protein
MASAPWEIDRRYQNSGAVGSSASSFRVSFLQHVKTGWRGLPERTIGWRSLREQRLRRRNQAMQVSKYLGKDPAYTLPS